MPKYPILLLMLALQLFGYGQSFALQDQQCNTAKVPAVTTQSSQKTGLFLFTPPSSSENQPNSASILFFENEEDDKVENNYYPSDFFTLARGYFFSYGKSTTLLQSYYFFTLPSHRYLFLQVFRI